MGNAIGELFVTIGADLKDFDAGVDKVKSDLSGISGAISEHSKAFQIAGGAMAGAAIGAGVAGLKMAADYEGAMREVNTMMQLSGDDFDSLSQDVLKLSQDVGKAPEEMAKALYQIVSAGVPAADALDVLRTSAQAAIGGVTDTTTAVDGITTVLNAFHMSADQADSVAATMFQTVKSGKTTFDELSSYMFQVANSAAALEVPFTTVSGALATMTKQGIPTAQATTQLRQAMVALTKPTDGMKKKLKDLGYETGKALIQAEGFDGALNLLRESTGGNDEELAKMFGSVEALNAVLSLTGSNADMFADDLANSAKAAEDATAATDAYNEMNKGTSRQFEQLQTQVQVMAIQLGNALMPALTELLEVVTPIIKAVADWIEKNPKLTAALVAVVAAVGSLLLILGSASTIIGGAEAAIAAFGIAMDVALGPIGLIIAAIAALAVAGYLIYDNWDAITEFFSDLWDSVYEIFRKIWDTIVDLVKKYWDLILAVLFPAVGLPILITRHWGQITEAVSAIWDTVVGFFKDNWKLILGIIFPAYGLYQLVSDNWGKITEAVKSMWDTVVGFFRDNWKLILGIIFPQYGLYQLIQANWGRITGLVQTIFNSVVDNLRGFPVRVMSAISSVKDIIIAPFQSAWNYIKQVVQWIIDQIKRIPKAMSDAISSVTGGVSKIASTVTGGASSTASTVWKYVTPWAEGGIVTEPTLSLIGEAGPEAVIPLNSTLGGLLDLPSATVPALGRLPGGGGLVLQMNFSDLVILDREESVGRLADNIYDRIKREQRLTYGEVLG